jgi:Arc/MetJ-type ribon-helix-helix transcriptional regulator
MNEVIIISDTNMPKQRLQVTIREDIVHWIDKQVEKLRFASRSHALEYAMLQLMQEEKEKKE